MLAGRSSLKDQERMRTRFGKVGERPQLPQGNFLSRNTQFSFQLDKLKAFSGAKNEWIFDEQQDP